MDRDNLQQPQSIRQRLLRWLRLTDEVTIKAYHGYGHAGKLTLYGHVLRLGPLPRKKYRKSFVRNTLALLRLFIVKPFAGVKVELEWKENVFESVTEKDGFFKFEWSDTDITAKGWQKANLRVRMGDSIIAKTAGAVYIPYKTQYGFISDIDDTFLISHSSNLRKRLFVLFTQNARSRKPFEGVVNHYQLLAQSNTTAEAPNPFFFVSSSEWNLYDYIVEFAQTNKIPDGVFLLNTLKLFRQLLKTGQNNHQAKFTRIVRILENYPEQKFVLLGDSSQQDPYIYAAIVSHFPGRIQAVYIRDVVSRNKKAVEEVLQNILADGVPVCFFNHSSEAIIHSEKNRPDQFGKAGSAFVKYEAGTLFETTSIEKIISMEKNLQDEEALKKFSKLVNDIKVCMFITNNEENDHTRPMATIEVDDNGTLWFFTDVRSIKVEEINNEHDVHLVYAHPGKESYVDVWGKANVSRDKQLIKDKWSPIVKAWFPDGVDDPNLALLKVQPTNVYYWDAETGKMVAFLKIAASVVTGTTLAEGAQGKLKV